MTGRFQKGQSGNPGGRPRKRRPNVSAFDIIIDKTLTVTQNGVEREFTIDEALQLQTYQAALKGGKMAVRQVLKMIEKREVALAKATPPLAARPMGFRWEHEPRNADQAMLILGITARDPSWTDDCQYGVRMKLNNWAAQAAISRPGRKKLTPKEVEDVARVTLESETLKWPRRSGGE